MSTFAKLNRVESLIHHIAVAVAFFEQALACYNVLFLVAGKPSFTVVFFFQEVIFLIFTS